MYIRMRNLFVLMCAILLCTVTVTSSALPFSETAWNSMSTTNMDIPEESIGIVMDSNGILWYMPDEYPLTFLSQDEANAIHNYNLYTIVDYPINDTRENREVIWDYWYYKTGNAYGTAGLMGNMYVESGFNPKNLQNSFERKYGWTNDTYTAAADNGTYTNFGKDGAGYGLVQWTYWKYKQGLLDYAKDHNKSVGDMHLQLDYLNYQFSDTYAYVGDDIRGAKSIRFASDSVMLNFERPANQSEENRARRAAHGKDIYDACIHRCETLDEIRLYIHSQTLNAEGRAKALETQLQFNVLFNDIKTSVHDLNSNEAQ